MENKMEQNEMEIVTMEERTEENMIAKLTDQKTVSFCSMKPKNVQEKVALFNAMNNADKRIAECVNMTILVKDVFVEVVECTNEQTGEVTQCPRTILIDTDGEGYVAVSKGVFNSLTKLIQVFGVPTWEKGLPIIPKQITKGNNKITTLSVGKIK